MVWLGFKPLAKGQGQAGSLSYIGSIPLIYELACDFRAYQTGIGVVKIEAAGHRAGSSRSPVAIVRWSGVILTVSDGWKRFTLELAAFVATQPLEGAGSYQRISFAAYAYWTTLHCGSSLRGLSDHPNPGGGFVFSSPSQPAPK